MGDLFSSGGATGPTGPTGPAGPPNPTPSNTFVFRPGGVAGGNVYTSWAALFAAATAVSGPRTVEFDTSGGGSMTIPAGAWDFGAQWDTEFIAAQTSAVLVALSIAGTLNGVCLFRGLTVTYTGAAAPCMSPGAQSPVIKLDNVSTLRQTGGQPFLSVTGGTTLVLFTGNSTITTVGCFTVSAGTLELIISSGGAPNGLAAVTQTGGSLIVVMAGSAARYATNNAQPALANLQGWLQGGTSTLVNGVSPAIAGVTLTAASRIVALRKDVNASTALGTLGVATADRTAGVGVGSFVVRSLDAAGAAVAGDQSSFDWLIFQ